MLRKLFVIRVIPGEPAVEGREESLTCFPLPPPDSSGETPPTPPEDSADPGAPTGYMYVPDDTTPSPGQTIYETRTPYFGDDPEGYTCADGLYFLYVEGTFGGVMVYERRCYFNYPPPA